MIARGAHLLQELEADLARGDEHSLLRLCADQTLRDGDLAELIEADARWRIAHGLGVTLERYVQIVADLDRRPISLDAAIEFSLRARSGSSRPSEAAVAELVEAYPQLATGIRNAAALSAGLATTRTLRGLERTHDTRTLPCSFGPVLRDGKPRFELTERLGAGAQGDVYLAIDRALSEPDRPALAAIKILAAAGWSDSERWRSIDEATRARRINHPNVVRVLDRGSTDDGEEFVVYEYIDGGDLERWLTTHRSDAKSIARLISQIARGVQAAHSAGLVHRDLKPANVLLTAADEPKVTDFGVATAAGIGLSTSGVAERRGNLAFIAPEQYRGDDSSASASVDVYALGGLLYFACTGKMPNGDTAEEIAATHAASGGRTEAPPVSSLLKGFDHDLAAICRHALAPKPEERYASADALANDLDAWLRSEPLPWTHPSPARRARLLLRREPRLVAAIGAALLAVLVGVGGTVYAWTSGAARTKLARREAEINKEFADSELQKRELTTRAIGFWRKFMHEHGDLRVDDWFVSLTILESLTGPYFFDPRAADREIWASRTRVAMAIVGDNSLRGTPNSIESLLWSDMAAYWMLRANEYDGADMLLSRCDAAWECKLEAQDRWRDIRSALRAIVVVQRHKDKGAKSPSVTLKQSDLTGAVATLRRIEATMSVGPQDDSLHRLVLKTLADAYGPDLMDRAEDRAWALVRGMDVRNAAMQSNPTGNEILDRLYSGRERRDDSSSSVTGPGGPG